MLGFLRKQITADVLVKITPDGKGGHTFLYSGNYFQSNGDFDFSKGGARKHAVKIDFAIADGSVAGVKFKPVGDDAFWIVEKIHVGANGCPEGPYKGDQFKGVTTLADGRRLHVIDKNDDGKLYRYMLRFDLNGKLICDDPEGQNDSDPPH